MTGLCDLLWRDLAFSGDKMEISGAAIGASTVTSAFIATLRISQAVYELKAVGEQTRDLLDTTKYIDDSTRHVRLVRRQKSALLTATEKEWIDGQIRNCEKAVRDVAALIEPARVDMQTRSNNTRDIRFKNRVMFVLRDSPNVAVQLTKLSIATQGLNTAMGVLCNREGYGGVGKSKGAAVPRIDRRSSSPSKKAPPTYELSEFMNRRRMTTDVGSRRIALKQRVSKVAFTEDDRSDAESVTLSGPQSQAEGSSANTMEEPGHIPEHAGTETSDTVLASANPTSSSSSRDAPHLDRFDTSPACIPVLTFGDLTNPVHADAYSLEPGHSTDDIEAWRLETLQALGEKQNVPAPILKDQSSFSHLSSSVIPSASVSQMSLDSGMAQMALSGNPFPGQKPNLFSDETSPSHPPLPTHASEPMTSQTPVACPPPIPPRPTSFQSQHLHSPSINSVHDGFLQQASVLNPEGAASRLPPFYFTTPQRHSNENSKLEAWGRSGLPKSTEPTQFASNREPTGIAEQRVSRGRTWLEHHAEKSITLRESTSGPPSADFLTPGPPPRVREI